MTHPVDRRRLAELTRLAEALRDRDLSHLAAATKAVQAVERHLAALEQPDLDCSDVGDALAKHRYDRWADARRRLLMPERDRLEQARQDYAEKARQSFGRALALRRIEDQLS